MAIKSPPRGYGPGFVQRRREWFREQTGKTIDVPMPEADADYHGIVVNWVGAMPIPMALVGPLVIEGEALDLVLFENSIAQRYRRDAHLGHETIAHTESRSG